MKIKRFFARISAVLAIFFSQSLADFRNDMDSNKSSATIDSAPPPHLQHLRIYKNPKYLAQVDLSDSSTDSSNSNDSNIDSAHSDDDNYDNYEVVDIGTSTIRAKADPIPYQSGESVSKQILDSSPSGNGDITSILRVLPNVQFDTASGSSNTPGEIDPANISISGGLFYQNNFQLDGFNMNNDLDPAGGGTTDNQTSIRSGKSQGLNIDTSLLDSIMVLDSNISASYGGFSGGVVDAKVRKARRDGWHGNVSYQFTQGNANPKKFSLTQYYYDERAESNLFLSADERYQPEFTKHLVKSSLEGYITENLGFVASFTTTQSFIPLSSYRNLASYRYGNDLDSTRDNKRISYNYYLKAHYDLGDNLSFEGNIGYAPQHNTYYNDAAANSYYTMDSGGWQGGGKVMWNTKAGVWTNSFGYSSLENSRRGDANYFYQWYRSADKNWGGNRAIVWEGGWGNVNQLQKKLEIKSEFESVPIMFSVMKNIFRFGVGYDKFQIVRNYLNDVHWFQGMPTIMTGQQHCGTDSLGFSGTCSDSPTINVTTGQPNNNNGQVMLGASATQGLRIRPAGKYEYWGNNYNAYLEDDIRVDLGKGGDLNVRPGIRYDGDNYMGKHTFAPRFAMNYVTPAPKDWQTTLTFGANRYYGRNLFSYWLYAQSYSQWQLWRRVMCNGNGTATGGYTCSSGPNAPSDWLRSNDYNLSSFFHFDKLKVPYDDEIMGGIKQELGIFEVSVKYIRRFGRDEIMRQDTGNTQTRADYYWNNNGSSQSHIVAFSIQNMKPIQTFGVNHNYLFAFDYTQTKRGYNVWFNTHNGVDRDDDEYLNNGLIYYDGKLIHYRDRPVENFIRPWTLRLNATHSFEIGRTRWLLNNLFRYRATFERMINNGYITIDGENYVRYDKMKFNGAFNWDMRVGFEVDFYRGEKMRHTLYINVDIFNVLNAKNMTSLQATGATNSNGSIRPGIASAGDYAVYETGRQFWFQIGYKF